MRYGRQAVGASAGFILEVTTASNGTGNRWRRAGIGRVLFLCLAFVVLWKPDFLWTNDCLCDHLILVQSLDRLRVADLCF